MGCVDKSIQYGLLLDKDAIAFGATFGHLHIVAHFTLQANVCYKPHTCFGIHARKVAGIGVTIGVAILYIKDVNEIDSVL